MGRDLSRQVWKRLFLLTASRAALEAVPAFWGKRAITSLWGSLPSPKRGHAGLYPGRELAQGLESREKSGGRPFAATFSRLQEGTGGLCVHTKAWM